MSDVPPPPPPPPPPVPPPPPPPFTGAPPGYGASPGYGAPPAYGFGTGPTGRLAGFWPRLGARLLDGLLYGLASAPFVVVSIVLIARALEDCRTVDRFDGTSEIVCPPGAPDGASLAGGIVVLAVGLLLVAFLYLRALARTGQTWGRKIAGVRVVAAETGGPPGWGKAIGRSLFAQFISGFLALGYLWMLWDRENRTWHDMVAGTRVFKD